MPAYPCVSTPVRARPGLEETWGTRVRNPLRLLLASGRTLAMLPLRLVALVVFVVVAGDSPQPAAGGLPPDPGCAPPPAPDGVVAGFQGEQLANAALIVQAGKQMRLPAHAWVVAVATAMQESSLHDIAYGDEAGPDSLGVFQQRTSWGPAPDRLDPYKSAKIFYAHLIAIPGWDTLPLTAAAQGVQRSQFPDAYAEREPAADQVVAAVADIPCQPVRS
jgi:hypothetical protein